jgi:hypothetical protein
LKFKKCIWCEDQNNPTIRNIFHLSLFWLLWMEFFSKMDFSWCSIVGFMGEE